MPHTLLVVSSETPAQEDARRRSVGASSAESLAETLRGIVPGAALSVASCVSSGGPPEPRDLRRFDAVLFAGSPISMAAPSAEARAAAAFMLAAFSSGTPCFGSCAGLQIAAVAAGGRSGPRERGQEAGLARGIVATDAGRSHPLLRGRPPTWDAPSNHGDRVLELPRGATVLALSGGTPVQAAEIRHGEGIFQGVQYHPELTLAEIAAALRREASDLVGEGLARDEAAVAAHAARLEELHRDPARRDLAWQLGVDAEVLDPVLRTREIRNFLARFVGAA